MPLLPRKVTARSGVPSSVPLISSAASRMVRDLIEAKADVNLQTTESVSSPLRSVGYTALVETHSTPYNCAEGAYRFGAAICGHVVFYEYRIR